MIRFTVAPLLILLVVRAILLDSYRAAGNEPLLWIPILLLILGTGSAAELFRMCRLRGLRPAWLVGMILLIALLARRFGVPNLPVHAILAVYLSVKLAVRRPDFSIPDAAATMLVFSYLSLLEFLDGMAGESPQPWLMLFLFWTSKMPDVGGYLGGRWFGRTPLAPALSPKKTWEGAAAGFALGFGGGCALLLATPLAEGLDRSTAGLIVWTAAVTMASVIGDLVKSAWKRWAGIKDSGFFPEVGGFLDLLDSFLLTAPVAVLGLRILPS